MLRKTLLALGLALPVTAHADDARMHEAFRRATEIVESHSHYREIPPVRHWVKVQLGDMARLAIRNDAAGDQRLVVAMFVCQEKAMYLSEALDPDDPEQMAIVVHEMVHHAQCEAGRYTRDTCPAEREAYAIQAAYLRSVERHAMNGRANGSDAAESDNRTRDLERTAESACRAARNR